MLPSNAKILVVEDEAILALDLEYLLRELGAGEVIDAYSLKDAALELKRHPGLHLALVDVHLGDGSGLQLIETLKEREVPVILTTGYEGKLPDVPVNMKPYQTEALVAAVDEALK